MRHNYKKMVIAAGMAAIIACMPVTAMAGTLHNRYTIESGSSTAANDIQLQVQIL